MSTLNFWRATRSESCTRASVNRNTEAEWNTFNEIYGKFGAPLYCLPGNHDLDRVSNESGQRLATYKRRTASFPSKGQTYYTVEKGSCAFICLDTSTTKIGSDQLAWLKKELERTREAKHVFILGHHPAYGPWGGTITDGREELLKLMKRYKVAGYLCGHRHRYRYRVKDGSAHVLCDCLSWGTRLSYMVYHVFPDRIVACWKPVGLKPGMYPLYERVVFPEPRAKKTNGASKN